MPGYARAPTTGFRMSLVRACCSKWITYSEELIRLTRTIFAPFRLTLTKYVLVHYIRELVPWSEHANLLYHIVSIYETSFELPMSPWELLKPVALKPCAMDNAVLSWASHFNNHLTINGCAPPKLDSQYNRIFWNSRWACPFYIWDQPLSSSNLLSRQAEEAQQPSTEAALMLSGSWAQSTVPPPHILVGKFQGKIKCLNYKHFVWNDVR
jgi:hypothetical protein